jgi:hypothetical protein
LPDLYIEAITQVPGLPTGFGIASDLGAAGFAS